MTVTELSGNRYTLNASGIGSSLNAIFQSASSSIVETDLSRNIDIIAPYQFVANGRQMAPLKCPIVASNGSGTNMFKTGTCYPVINTSSDYSNLLAGIKSLLMGNGI